MRHERWLDERRLDQLFEYCSRHLEIFILLSDLRTQFDRTGATLLRRDLKPIRSGFFTYQVLVLRATPWWSQVDGARNLSVRILVLDLECADRAFGYVTNQRLHQLDHRLVITIGLIRLQHCELRVMFAGQTFVPKNPPQLEH